MKAGSEVTIIIINLGMNSRIMIIALIDARLRNKKRKRKRKKKNKSNKIEKSIRESFLKGGGGGDAAVKSQLFNDCFCRDCDVC